MTDRTINVGPVWCPACKRPYADSAPVNDREGVPEGWRVEWLCPSGARSCDRIGPGHQMKPVLVPVSPSVDPEEE